MVGEDDLITLVDQLRRDRRQHPYRGRREYSQTARAVADGCERLIEAGHAERAAPVLRKAVDRATRALMYMDDSSGIVGNDLQHLIELYARACTAIPPKPAALAKWLVTLACDGPGWPRIRLSDFAGALGEPGLSEIARLVEERGRTADPRSWTAVFSVRDLREQLAEVSGDVDHYVSVLAEGPANAIRYERIVDALRGAGRYRDAITWARRGLADKPGRPRANQLRDTIVAILLAEEEPEEAVQVRREEFARQPTLTNFRALAATSTQAGADDPTSWALQILTDRVARQPQYASELVEMLSALGRHDDAWDLAQQYRAALGDPQRLRLLDHRRTEHPQDVLTPYRDMIEQRVLNSGDKHRYRKAVALLPALRDAYAKAGDQAGFMAYLKDLRARHTRRPTFIKALDAADFRSGAG